MLAYACGRGGTIWPIIPLQKLPYLFVPVLFDNHVASNEITGWLYVNAEGTRKEEETFTILTFIFND